MQLMSDCGIDAKEIRYISMVEEYQRMKAEGLKGYYIVVHLAEKYNISVRGVYKIISRYKETIKL